MCTAPARRLHCPEGHRGSRSHPDTTGPGRRARAHALGHAEIDCIGRRVEEVVPSTLMGQVIDSGQPILVDLLSNQAGTPQGDGVTGMGSGLAFPIPTPFSSANQSADVRNRKFQLPILCQRGDRDAAIRSVQ